MRIAENPGLFDRLTRMFRLEESIGRHFPRVMSPYVVPVFDLHPSPDPTVTKRLYLQDLGDFSMVDKSGASVLTPFMLNPLPADLHGDAVSSSGTSTSTTDEAVLTINPTYPFYTFDKLRIKGMVVFATLLGVVSNNASGVATLTSVQVKLQEIFPDAPDTTNVINTFGDATATVAKAVTGTTESKESVVVAFPNIDYEFEQTDTIFRVQCILTGKTNNASYTTTLKQYYTAGSNDTYIDLPFL